SVHTQAELARLRRATGRAGDDRDAALTLLIDTGMLEAALLDATAPERDGCGPLATAARRVTRAAADVWLARAAGTKRDTTGVAVALARLHDATLPSRMTLRVPEGFAYYALFPETYVAAVDALL